jgi:phosphatidylglycerol:prolipoprotein diacylglycerol transferase
LYGGLLPSLLLSFPLLKALDLDFMSFWDIEAYTILVAMIFTKLGCLLNGCCSGKPNENSLSMNLPDHKGILKKRFPTQLLEAGWAAFLLLVGIVLLKDSLFPGSFFLLGLAGYGAGRMVLEWMREEQGLQLGKVNFNQLFSGMLFILASVLWLAKLVGLTI